MLLIQFRNQYDALMNGTIPNGVEGIYLSYSIAMVISSVVAQKCFTDKEVLVLRGFALEGNSARVCWQASCCVTLDA